ncbi:hypothetical protein LMG9964_04113 [Paraburkholderia phenoliruptrix]|uniref:Uncharacterized protein n=1 Tax=Paraburkholderia phenoliruptrix TaxID=252970 RepID=A0A6J5K9Z5_9BURK|nr:hypothetical protein LMG9964_04113 [Paraburkholderia phenoliruptrix]
MKKAVWGLIIVAIVSWGICYIYSTNIIHFGWIGTLFASTAGLIATISSYHTEDVAHTRGGTICKAESRIKFLLIYVLLGLLLAAFLLMSILGSLGKFGVTAISTR